MKKLMKGMKYINKLTWDMKMDVLSDLKAFNENAVETGKKYWLYLKSCQG